LPSAQYSFTVDSDTYSNLAECNGVIGSPERFGFNRRTDGSSFTFKVDVRSFASAVSINKGFGSLRAQPRYETLHSAPQQAIEHLGHTYFTSYYIDNSYPGMSPLLCLVEDLFPSTMTEYPSPLMTPDGLGVNQLCMLQVGEVVMLPTFQHFGDSPKGSNGVQAEPRPCSW
jgi:hypothetical protein